MSIHTDDQTNYSDPSTDIDEFYQTDFYSDAGEVVDVKNNKREREAQIDSGKHVIQRHRGGKPYRIVLYSTGTTPGSLIRNAVNGSRYNYRVGDAEEDLFFSSVLATGEVGPTSSILFYDTPEQYEAHFRVSLPEGAKAKWLVKYNVARDKLEYAASKGIDVEVR